MSRPVMLDLFCGRVGGAARGYQHAGWYVVGVDNVDCPDYAGDEFVKGDALMVADYILRPGGRTVAVHASPPCQGRGYLARGSAPELADRHPDMIPATRDFLSRRGLPYVIENVGGSAVRPDLVLCGEMFGLGVIMHRKFELSGFSVSQPEHLPHRGYVRGWRHGVWRDGPYVAAYGKGGGKATAEEMRVAKGVDWSFDHLGLRDALPPAYTETIGRQMMAATRR